MSPRAFMTDGTHLHFIQVFFRQCPYIYSAGFAANLTMHLHDTLHTPCHALHLPCHYQRISYFHPFQAFRRTGLTNRFSHFRFAIRPELSVSLRACFHGTSAIVAHNPVIHSAHSPHKVLSPKMDFTVSKSFSKIADTVSFFAPETNTRFQHFPQTSTFPSVKYRSHDRLLFNFL